MYVKIALNYENWRLIISAHCLVLGSKTELFARFACTIIHILRILRDGPRMKIVCTTIQYFNFSLYPPNPANKLKLAVTILLQCKKESPIAKLPSDFVTYHQELQSYHGIYRFDQKPFHVAGGRHYWAMLLL